MGALKRGGWRVGGVWHSLPAQERVEAQMSAKGHFNGALKWVGCGSSGEMRTEHCQVDKLSCRSESRAAG